MDAGSDPALSRYLALPPERRQHDFWLDCFGDPYWASEYRSRRGEPLPFTTDFVIHVEPVSPGTTRVEILEYFPHVVAGRKLGFERNAVLPSLVWDFRRVPPTTVDRARLLERVRQALEQR